MARRIWRDNAEGGTPLSAAALNGMEDDIEAGKSFYLTMGDVGVGVAGASLGERQPDGKQTLDLTLPQMDTYGWLVACFLDNGVHGEKLNLFYSPDGKTIFGGQNNPAYSADRLRDPSIIYWKGAFYVAFTLADGVGRNFRIIRSETGMPGSWEVVATPSVSGLVPVGDKCWAPELVIDGEDVYVFFTWQKSKTTESSAGAGNGSGSAMGWVKATNALLTAWSAPTALNTTGFSAAYIDGVPVQYGSAWYFFSSGGSQIYRAKSTTGITGKYTQDKTGNWAGWGTGIEGPYITKIGETFRIYYDRYVGNLGHWYSESSDLTTWSTPQPVKAAPNTLPLGASIRHGSFLQLPNMQAGMKALAVATTQQGPLTANFTQSRSVPNAASTDMGAATSLTDNSGMLNGGLDSAGVFRPNQGGLYLLTVDTRITSAASTASRVFIDLADIDGNAVVRMPMGGEGEDFFTSTVQVALTMNQGLKLRVYHNQGAAKTFTINTRITRLGSV